MKKGGHKGRGSRTPAPFPRPSPDAASDRYTADSLNEYLDDVPVSDKPLAALEWLLGPQW